MTTKKANVYVVMRKSGAIMHFKDGLGGPKGHTAGGYLYILNQIAEESGQAGRDYDVPHKLFLNGVEVVSGGLYSLASGYSRDCRNASKAAADEVKRMHAPAWVPDDEGIPTRNPPGIDIWEVKKVR